MLEDLKKEVYEANLELVKRNLVIYTWGNVSARDPETNYVVIKPSGVSYDKMKPEDMVVVDLNGKVIEGSLKPSSDTATHLELYRAEKEIQAVVHTHAKWATILAQGKKAVPALGTTHADYFHGEIPITRTLKKYEVESHYEKNTGLVIVEAFRGRSMMECPSVLVEEHGPFSWGKSTKDAVHNAVVLEYIAEMAYYSMILRDGVLNQDLLDKHYLRKHGAHKYYGQ